MASSYYDLLVPGAKMSAKQEWNLHLINGAVCLKAKLEG
jgi:hypothetical protein